MNCYKSTNIFTFCDFKAVAYINEKFNKELTCMWMVVYRSHVLDHSHLSRSLGSKQVRNCNLSKKISVFYSWKGRGCSRPLKTVEDLSRSLKTPQDLILYKANFLKLFKV